MAKIEIEISDEMLPTVEAAYRDLYGFTGNKPNPEARPEPIEDEEGNITNQEALDSYQDTVEQSFLEFLKEHMVNKVRSTVASYKARQAESGQSEEINAGIN